jgi:hypothetical protein
VLYQPAVIDRFRSEPVREYDQWVRGIGTVRLCLCKRVPADLRSKFRVYAVNFPVRGVSDGFGIAAGVQRRVPNLKLERVLYFISHKSLRTDPIRSMQGIRRRVGAQADWLWSGYILRCQWNHKQQQDENNEKFRKTFHDVSLSDLNGSPELMDALDSLERA